MHVRTSGGGGSGDLIAQKRIKGAHKMDKKRCTETAECKPYFRENVNVLSFVVFAKFKFRHLKMRKKYGFSYPKTRLETDSNTHT